MQFKIILAALISISNFFYAMEEPVLTLDWKVIAIPEFEKHSIESQLYNYPQCKIEQEPRRVISLLDAFIAGTITGHAKFVEFTDYANYDETYLESHENFAKIIATVYTKMQWLTSNGWQPDCKKDLKKILELSAGVTFPEKKKIALRRFKHLTECDKLQMVSDDFYRFMTNKDLADGSDANAKPVIFENRDLYKRSALFYAKDFFNAACKKQLHLQPVNSFNQSIQDFIGKINAATDADVQSVNTTCASM